MLCIAAMLGKLVPAPDELDLIVAGNLAAAVPEWVTDLRIANLACPQQAHLVGQAIRAYVYPPAGPLTRALLSWLQLRWSHRGGRTGAKLQQVGGYLSDLTPETTHAWAPFLFHLNFSAS